MADHHSYAIPSGTRSLRRVKLLIEDLRALGVTALLFAALVIAAAALGIVGRGG